MSARDLLDSDFQTQVLDAAGVVLVDAWAPWCGPCRALMPFIDRLAQEFAGEVSVLKLNVDQNPQTSATLGVRAVPSLFVFKDGAIFKEFTGSPDPKVLVDALEDALGTPE